MGMSVSGGGEGLRRLLFAAWQMRRGLRRLLFAAWQMRRGLRRPLFAAWQMRRGLCCPLFAWPVCPLTVFSCRRKAYLVVR